MEDNFKLEIISPEKIIFSDDVQKWLHFHHMRVI